MGSEAAAILASQPVNLNTILLGLTLLSTAVSPIIVAWLGRRVAKDLKDSTSLVAKDLKTSTEKLAAGVETHANEKSAALTDTLNRAVDTTHERLEKITDLVNGDRHRLQARLDSLIVSDDAKQVRLDALVAEVRELREAALKNQPPPATT